MINIAYIKKIATSGLAIAGFIILPISALAAPVVTLQSTAVSNGAGGINYHIIVTNTGDEAANDVFLRATLATNESFTSSVPPADISSTQNSQMMLTWHPLSSIAPGATYVVDLDTIINGSFPTGTIVRDSFEVEGLNFTTQTATTTVLTGPIATSTPTPTATPTATPTPITLPVTGVNPLVLTLIILGGALAGALISRPSLKNS